MKLGKWKRQVVAGLGRCACRQEVTQEAIQHACGLRKTTSQTIINVQRESFSPLLHPELPSIYTHFLGKEGTHFIPYPDSKPEGTRVNMAPHKRNNPARSANSRSPKSKRQRQYQAPAVKTFPIPDRLQDFVEKVERKGSRFELRFPIGDLDGVKRLAWGLDQRAGFVIVNLEFLQGEDKSSGHARFCVHSSTDKAKRSHQYSSTSSDIEKCIGNPCSSRSTILTCVLSRELFELLGVKGCRDLGTIYDRVLELVRSDPTRCCLVCRKEYDQVKVYTPTACLGACLNELDTWPLRARLSHLLSDTKVLDLLLCCIYTAVKGQEAHRDKYGTDSSLLVDCPLPLDEIQPTIDSFPKLSSDLGMQQMVNSSGNRGSFRRQLLSWLTLRFRGCIVSLTRNAAFLMQGRGLDGSHQFMVLNSRLERQQAFMEEASKIGGVGSVAFHGVKAPRAFNIITDALRNMISEPYAVIEPGIFYSDNPAYSLSYTQTDIALMTWKQSQFSGRDWSVLFGLEVALPQIPFRGNEHSTLSESTLMIRYIFLVPSSNDSIYNDYSLENVDDLEVLQDAMKKAYEVLDRQTLSPRHIGFGVKRDPPGKTAKP